MDKIVLFSLTFVTQQAKKEPTFCIFFILFSFYSSHLFWSDYD